MVDVVLGVYMVVCDVVVIFINSFVVVDVFIVLVFAVGYSLFFVFNIRV